MEKNTATVVDDPIEHGKLCKRYFNKNVRLNYLFMENLIDSPSIIFDKTGDSILLDTLKVLIH